MRADAIPFSYLPSCLDLELVTLPVLERHGIRRVPLINRHRQNRRRIEAAAQKNYRWTHHNPS